MGSNPTSTAIQPAQAGSARFAARLENDDDSFVRPARGIGLEVLVDLTPAGPQAVPFRAFGPAATKRLGLPAGSRPRRQGSPADSATMPARPPPSRSSPSPRDCRRPRNSRGRPVSHDPSAARSWSAATPPIRLTWGATGRSALASRVAARDGRTRNRPRTSAVEAELHGLAAHPGRLRLSSPSPNRPAGTAPSARGEGHRRPVSRSRPTPGGIRGPWSLATPAPSRDDGGGTPRRPTSHGDRKRWLP